MNPNKRPVKAVNIRGATTLSYLRDELPESRMQRLRRYVRESEEK